MMMLRSALLGALALGLAAPTLAQDEASGITPDILPLRERVEVIDDIIEERLDTIIPQIMREEGVDMWLLMAREYFEEPVIDTMLDARSMAARRRTILIFFDPGDGQPIERMTVSRYGLAGLFEPAWDPDVEPNQWQAVADIITARDPQRLAINYSDLTAFGDGMTLSQYRSMMAALPDDYEDRIVSGETLAVRWLETRTPSEIELYPTVVQIAHAIMARAFSREVITPGETTADDVVWWYRDEVDRLGLVPWFQPSVAIQREGADGFLRGDEIIQPGDLLWTDFGITYLRLNTDTQQLAYVLREGETEAPAGLRHGLANTNQVQDTLVRNYAVGRSGNEALRLTREQAIAEGLDPSVYTHPIGTHGHGAGPAIGFWDNQEADPRGAMPINANTAWAIELTSYAPVPEWGGQVVDFRSEKNAIFDGETVRYIDGRQTELILIPSGD
ncbi:aminopeptidase P family protein [Maricaulaceae bacterium NA33B04]|nr:aminopeptidase P family protein [Maricaulaceae bacterium NA33B04]